jgi:hypothetical protein
MRPEPEARARPPRATTKNDGEATRAARAAASLRIGKRETAWYRVVARGGLAGASGSGRKSFHREDRIMHKYLASLLLLAVLAPWASAHWWFAEITAVDVEKGIVTYTITFGNMKNTEVKAGIVRDCVIKEGFYRLGKPAAATEEADIANGLKNALFKKASRENPLRVNIFTANEDDNATGIQRGDILKILVNPPFKGKKQ